MPDTFVQMPEGWDNVWWCWLCGARACPVPPLTTTNAVMRHLAEQHPTPMPEEAQMEEINPTHEAWARKAILEAPDQESQIKAVAQQIANAEARGERRMDGSVRVVRLLEYIYPNAKDALKDQQNWQVQGVYRPSAGRLIRSTVLPMEVLD
jgi:hypothetical protein